MKSGHQLFIVPGCQIDCIHVFLKVCGLSEASTQDRVSWRSSVKNSRQEPTPSNGSAPQSMAAPPARRVLGMCTRSFNKTGFDWWIDWLIDWLIEMSPLAHMPKAGQVVAHCICFNDSQCDEVYLVSIFGYGHIKIHTLCLDEQCTPLGDACRCLFNTFWAFRNSLRNIPHSNNKLRDVKNFHESSANKQVFSVVVYQNLGNTMP